MTDSAKAVMWGFGKGFAVILSAAAIFSLGNSVGVKRGQLDTVADQLHGLQQSLAAEINARTANDADFSKIGTTISVQLIDIQRRLDRIERNTR